MPDDGEGPVTRKEAQERVKGWIDKPERRITKGSKRDDETRDDDLSDPAKQKGDEE